MLARSGHSQRGRALLDHVTRRVPDLAASAAFYTLVLRTLEIEISVRGNGYVEWDDFAIASANVETRMMTAAPPTKDMHVAFMAPSREHVDEFWRVGTEAGYRDNGAPGERVIYPDGYYAAFLLDPDGNNVEAVHHRSARVGTQPRFATSLLGSRPPGGAGDEPGPTG